MNRAQPFTGSAPIGGYLRISTDDATNARKRLARRNKLTDDRATDDAVILNEAIERQRQDVIDLLEDTGWNESNGWDGTIRWFVDQGVSAYQDKARPEFEAMLTALEAGEISGVATYHADRLGRQRADSDRFIRLYRKIGGALFATAEGPLDLRTERGEDALVDAIENAYRQSRASSRRVKRKHLENAKDGIPVGGKRPFGWAENKVDLHPDEAPILRWLVERTLAGEIPGHLAIQLRERGIKTSRGFDFKRGTVVAMLSQHRLYGARTLKGEVMRHADGQFVKMCEPICTEAEFDLLRSKYKPRAERTGQVHARRYLLSGILRCGRDGCGAAMVGYPRGGKFGHAYGCRARSEGTCGGVAIHGDHTDEAITELVLTAIERQQLGSVDTKPFDGAAQMARLEIKATEVRNAWKADLLTMADAVPMLDSIRGELDTLRNAERAHRQAQSALLTAGEAQQIRSRWESMTLAEKRERIKSVTPSIMVKPARQRGLKFDVTRLVIE